MHVVAEEPLYLSLALLRCLPQTRLTPHHLALTIYGPAATATAHPPYFPRRHIPSQPPLPEPPPSILSYPTSGLEPGISWLRACH